LSGTIRAAVGAVEDGVVAELAGGIISMGRVMGAMPMVLPLWRPFLENIVALRTEDIISETEILMKNQCPLRHPLSTILTLHVPILVDLFCLLLSL
jgi:hypothetical protein